MTTHMKMPDNTCPKIDKVLAILDDLKDEVNTLFSDALREVNSLMEEIRDANSKLRDAAETWCKEAEEAESEVERMKAEA